MYSKPFIKIIGILLLIVRFVRNSDHIRKKKKKVLMFLINPSNFHRDVCKTITTSKMKVFLVLLVSGLQPSTNVTKNSVLGAVRVLDLPLEPHNVF